jgi:hypothetical protein
MLSLAHPTLFSTLILMEPIIAPESTAHIGVQIARGALRRRVSWPTRLAAEKTFAIAFKSWDPRVLEKFNEYGLFPYSSPGKKRKDEVTRLATGRFPEIGSVARPTFIYDGNVEADAEWAHEAKLPHSLIGHLDCSVLYICGEMSFTSAPEIRNDCECLAIVQL